MGNFVPLVAVFLSGLSVIFVKVFIDIHRDYYYDLMYRDFKGAFRQACNLLLWTVFCYLIFAAVYIQFIGPF